MQKKKITLSVALAVKDEERNLSACLSSIKDIADEIVIVDGGSTDGTIEIARTFNAKIRVTGNPLIFHINKQKALDACEGKWILQLDADEVVSKGLKEEIQQVIYEKPPATATHDISKEVNGYFIPRKNYFLGRWLKKGGQYPDYVIRLVRGRYARFPCRSVHEQISVNGKIGYLKEPLLHYSYNSISEYWKKADIYTTLTAHELYKKGVKPKISAEILYNLIYPAQTFVSLFFRHKGFLDGWRGFLFALFSASHYPLAYRKMKKIGT